MNLHPNQITKEVIGAAIEVHRALGPGLLESAYQHCLARELNVRGIPFLRKCGSESNTRVSPLIKPIGWISWLAN
jgi:GxxExxY protein